MSSTVQIMHQRKENVGILGRLHLWHVQSHSEFIRPHSAKLVSDIASVDHLLIIAREIYKYDIEFRFKKHATDVKSYNNIGKII